MQRRWSVNTPINTAAYIQPHFNHAVGQWVTSSRDFDEKLKLAAERAGSTFSRVDPGDIPLPTADDHIFDTQMRTLTDKGFVSDSGKVSIDDGGHFLKQ